MAPAWLTRIIQISLGLHGVLHVVELATALYETAFITATLAAFGTMTMLLGAALLEPEQRAHHH
ncbi:MAG TPA: hypothetical protein QF651_10790 [Acidimicrobiales bacterium]|jgi:hypothetical protein|nr:hypothetical protein [Candidatus Thalassarchaeaceae archaeon]HJL54401.1 hypothetical protein [Candidatus Thalassarchaeaceae archaeon]HJM74019.1 hypothetical protein [Acidimicrobiales bacterium]